MYVIVQTAISFLANLLLSSRSISLYLDTYLPTTSKFIDGNDITATQIQGGCKKSVEIAMQNKAFLTNTSFFSRHPCSSIDKGHAITCYKKTKYVKGDILLDIIKESLIEKRWVIDGHYPHHLTLRCLEFEHANFDEETWNLGKALCRKVSQKIESMSVKENDYEHL